MASVGVDAWGVDYGLIDAGGALVEEPIAYRDPRTEGVMDAVLARVPRAEIFRRTGIQFMPINTIYQLAAHVRDGLAADAAGILLMPDLCHLFLSGSRSGEYTDASTTQLLDATTRQWDDALFARLGLPRALMPALVDPGRRPGHAAAGARRPNRGRPGRSDPRDRAGDARHRQRRRRHAAHAGLGLHLVGDVVVGRRRAHHAAPDRRGRGRELHQRGRRRRHHPLPEERDGAVGARRLPARVGQRAPPTSTRSSPVPRALPGRPGVIDVDDLVAAQPAEHARRDSRAADRDGPAHARRPDRAWRGSIFDSLAHGYAPVVAAIERLTGEAIPGIHVVGGGSRNAYLNQATADATGKPVLAGPVEATAAAT